MADNYTPAPAPSKAEFNALSQQVDTLNGKIEKQDKTSELNKGNYPADVTEYNDGTHLYVAGNVKTLIISIKMVNVANLQTVFNLDNMIPSAYRPSYDICFCLDNGDYQGITKGIIQSIGRVRLTPQKTGTTYAMGAVTWV